MDRWLRCRPGDESNCQGLKDVEEHGLGQFGRAGWSRSGQPPPALERFLTDQSWQARASVGGAGENRDKTWGEISFFVGCVDDGIGAVDTEAGLL